MEKRTFPVETGNSAQTYSEPLYEVYENGGKHYLKAFTDRKTAENTDSPVRHLTVIIVPL